MSNSLPQPPRTPRPEPGHARDKSPSAEPAGGAVDPPAGSTKRTGSDPALDRLFESLPIALYTCDSNGRITRCNHAAEQLWGRRPKIGVDTLCGSFRVFHPDGSSVHPDEAPISIALREGRPVRDRHFVIERPDGSRRHVMPMCDPIFDSRGQVSGAVNMMVDITALNWLA